MNIIALVPFKNEEWVLPAYAASMKRIADSIIGLDDGSSDASAAILKEAGAVIYSYPEASGEVNMSKRRNFLLEKGREHGGTHFIWLDADEIFSERFLAHGKTEMEKMKPGEKISLPWITLWKDAKHHRIDSVWKDLRKDVIVCDDPSLSFDDRFLSEARTPGPSDRMISLDSDAGVILHFQFIAWERTQAKQAWYRCRELIEGGRSARRINNMYSISLDSPKVETEAVPDAWLEHAALPERLPDSKWHTEAVIAWFDRYGILFFEPLQIWHVPELRAAFLERVGREPKAKAYPPLLILLNRLRRKAEGFFRRQQTS